MGGIPEVAWNGACRYDDSTYSCTARAPSVCAGRISFVFNLQGPCMTIDTACSGGLTVVDVATKYMSLGMCDVAIVAGVNLLLSPHFTNQLAAAKMLSPTNRCHTFGQSVDEYVRGEGCGAIIMRSSVENAIAFNHDIWATVRASMVSQDGVRPTLTSPNPTAQAMLIEEVIGSCHLEKDSIDAVECHGTGTPLGDPIEIAALYRLQTDVTRSVRALMSMCVVKAVAQLLCDRQLKMLLRLIMIFGQQ